MTISAVGIICKNAAFLFEGVRRWRIGSGIWTEEIRFVGWNSILSFCEYSGKEDRSS